MATHQSKLREFSIMYMSVSVSVNYDRIVESVEDMVEGLFEQTLDTPITISGTSVVMEIKQVANRSEYKWVECL